MSPETADAVHADLNRARAEIRDLARDLDVPPAPRVGEQENITSTAAERRRQEIAAAADRFCDEQDAEIAERRGEHRAQPTARARTG